MSQGKSTVLLQHYLKTLKLPTLFEKVANLIMKI